METKNSVFIATSLDGYIADKDGKIDWLNNLAIPENDDMGYNSFISEIDGLLMGRKSFETVCGFDVEWPYDRPVFVLSNTLDEVPEKYEGKAFIINGGLSHVLAQLHAKGMKRLYIDGGKTIQSLLAQDLVDKIIITIIPVLLGDGIPLFARLPNQLDFQLIKSKVYHDNIVQNHFERIRK